MWCQSRIQRVLQGTALVTVDSGNVERAHYEARLDLFTFLLSRKEMTSLDKLTEVREQLPLQEERRLNYDTTRSREVRTYVGIRSGRPRRMSETAVTSAYKLSDECCTGEGE